MMIALLVLLQMVPLGGWGRLSFRRNYHFKFQTPLARQYCLFSAGSMPNLPKRLAPLRAAVASSLLRYLHTNNLHSGNNIATVLNIAADVERDDARSVNATLLMRAFANEGANEFALACSNVLGRDGDTDILYVRKTLKHGKKAEGSDFCLAVGRFVSMDAAKCSKVVRWNCGIEEDVRAGLVRLLAEPKASKKRKVSEVSPVDGSGISSRTSQPLVEISGNVPTENTRGRSKGGGAEAGRDGLPVGAGAGRGGRDHGRRLLVIPPVWEDVPLARRLLVRGLHAGP